MRLGLIARADHRGLAIQTSEFHRAMQPSRTMIIDCPSIKPLPLHLEQFPGDGVSVVTGWPTSSNFSEFVDGLDCVYTAETSYGKAFWDEAERAGTKTILAANYEFLERDDRPSLWAAPSAWHFSDFPDPKVLLPVPVATDRFTSVIARRATRFLHVIGRPAIHDRAGTRDLLTALRHVRAAVTVTITCQQPSYVADLMESSHLPGHITVDIDDGDINNYWDLYTDQDVLVMPRRYGGLSLPMQEACAAAMPVIATAINPNTDWLPPEWLVPARKTGEFMAKRLIDLYTVDSVSLAAKIDQFATNPDFYRAAASSAANIAEILSWDNLASRYRETIEALCRSSASLTT